MGYILGANYFAKLYVPRMLSSLWSHAFSLVNRDEYGEELNVRCRTLRRLNTICKEYSLLFAECYIELLFEDDTFLQLKIS